MLKIEEEYDKKNTEKVLRELNKGLRVKKMNINLRWGCCSLLQPIALQCGYDMITSQLRSGHFLWLLITPQLWGDVVHVKVSSCDAVLKQCFVYDSQEYYQPSVEFCEKKEKSKRVIEGYNLCVNISLFILRSVTAIHVHN